MYKDLFLENLKLIEEKKFKILEDEIQEFKFSKQKGFDKSKDIIIYGAGGAGKIILEQLKGEKFNVKFFIDMDVNKEILDDVPVYTLEQAKGKIGENDICVISIGSTTTEIEKIKTQLKNANFKNIFFSYIPMIQYRFEFYNKNRDKIIESKNEILQVLDLLEDDISKKTYLMGIWERSLYDFSKQIRCWNVQYFDCDIPFSKGEECFVDCGAFYGDTYSIVNKSGKCKKYIGFEPNMESFSMLSNNIDLNNEIDNVWIYPCGVGEKNEFVRFKKDSFMSGIDVAGEETIQVVRLDDCLKNIKPTMIKMDIEGSELSALHGFKNTIQKEKPDLCISIYHYINHFWEIPSFLKEIVPEYKFYIRTYSNMSMETILYATT